MPASRTPSALSIRGWSSIVGASQSKIVDLLVENVANVAAVVGAVLLLADPNLPASVVGVVLALGALVLVGWLLRREAARRESLLAAYPAVRVVLAVAVAGGFLLRRADDPGWVWTATGLIVLSVLSEPTVKILLSKTEPVAEHLPGVPNVPRPPFSPSLLPVLSLALLALGGVLAALRAPGWIFLVVAVLGFTATLAMVGHAARANLVSKRSAAGVRKALQKYQPAFAVYYGGTQGARYQLGMWLPYLERLNRPFVVITRNAETVPVITELTTAPVLVPRLHSTVGNLDQMVVPSLKAAFYVQGSPANLTFQRYRKLTHVWLNHGDSDKAANFGARHATYDRIFVSGQQGVERYAAHGVNVPPERFALVGRPQIERIEVRDVPPAPGTPRTVLYAPTWRGGRPSTNYSSLPLGEKIVAALLARGCTVIFRPHPLSYAEPEDAGRIRAIQQRLEADTSGRLHVWGPRAETDWDIPACINASDALVTDVSSVAADHLASGKPLAMVAIRAQGAKFLAEIPMARVSYVIEKDLSTLQTALDQLLGDDPLAADRQAYRRHCIGDGVGPYAADEFLRVAGEIVDGVRSAR
ncbi:MAG: CDP-glycerol glycerophosphotransferase family protein [Propionibacteriaceae bacterium]